MDSAASGKEVEMSVAENVSMEATAGKDVVELSGKGSVAPLENITNSKSSEEAEAKADDVLPPVKRARVDDVEADHAEGSTDVKQIADEPVALLTNADIVGFSPEGKFTVVVFKEQIVLKEGSGDAEHCIPIDSIGRLFLLPQEHHSSLVMALNTPLGDESPISYVVLEVPSEAASSADALPKLIASLTGLDVLESAQKTSPSKVLSVACKYNDESGLLFPLQDGFFLLQKPPMHIAFSDMSNAELVHSEEASTMLKITMKDDTEMVFGDIQKEDEQRLDAFDMKNSIADGGKRLRRPLPGGSKALDQEDAPDSDDEDFVEGNDAKEDGSESDADSEPREEYDSNVEDTTQEDFDDETEVLDKGDAEPEGEGKASEEVPVAGSSKEGGDAQQADESVAKTATEQSDA